MENLVQITEGKATTTSLKIAEVFEKQHQHVLRAIRELQIPESFRQSNFGETVIARPNHSPGSILSPALISMQTSKNARCAKSPATAFFYFTNG